MKWALIPVPFSVVFFAGASTTAIGFCHNSLILRRFAIVLMLLSFSLLGIGIAIMQTSLNPLVSNLIGSDKLASTLTFGQFVKAIASFLAPIIAAWGATTVFPLAMGFAADAVGQAGAVAVMTVGVVYLLFYMLKIKKV